MPSATNTTNLSGGGVTISKAVVRTGDHPQGYEVALPTATAGTLDTRTSDTAGTVSASGHSITDGDIVDVYWDGGVAYGATVGTVSGDDVPFTGASGDALPIATTAVTIVEQVSINTAIDGDNIQIIGLLLETTEGVSGKGHIDMQDSGSSTIEEIDLVGETPQVYDIAGGASNVFTGNPITVSKASNGSSSTAATLKIISLEDSTP